MNSEKREEMKTIFDSYDRDCSGDLSMREVSKILLDIGLQPKNKEEQEEIQKMMEEVDEDGSMEINFEEFLLLFQRINEKLKAMELAFTEVQLADLRYAFDALDSDGSGTLEVTEIRRALQLMGRKIDSDKLRAMIELVDDDCSGELDFAEFLMLVRVIENDRESLPDLPEQPPPDNNQLMVREPVPAASDEDLGPKREARRGAQFG